MNRPMTVTQLSSYLKGVFEDEELLHDVTLTGEVADISYSDKHTFLTLADKDSSVKCVHFNSRDMLEKGAKVALVGSVRFYGRRSTVSFCYSDHSLCGEGEKNARLAQIKEKLYKQGYFENRPQLPKYVTSVVAVTSPDGAAIRDLIRVVTVGSPFVKIRVYPVKVQGEFAAAQITAAVKALQNYRTDAIVLCRGGGSDEDLDCFNDEELAVAVADSRIPVISAVGHEIDYTLCDFCAGTRAGTPSIAGQIINDHAQALINDLFGLTQRARSAIDSKMNERIKKLDGAYGDISRAVSRRIDERKNMLKLTVQRGYYALKRKNALRAAKLTSLAADADGSITRLISARRAEVERSSAVLRALDPKRILGTGYAAVIAADGRAVKSVHGISRGEHVNLIFADGAATATVNEVKPYKTEKQYGGK